MGELTRGSRELRYGECHISPYRKLRRCPRERESTGDSVGWCGTSAGAALHSHAQGPRPS
uniref:Uncharacterized protein n=1 Tax=Oryza glumipatula TaxID=40148 RepID=A0A0E0ATE6_9ORYZ